MKDHKALFEELKQFVDYNPETGTFVWKIITTNKVRNLSEAGTINNLGYRIIRFRNNMFLGHRFAWYLIYGEVPENDIDHINGNRADNRISNLQKATRRANLSNKKRHRNGALVGANYEKNRKKWRARCYVNGRILSLGSFTTEKEAHEVYIDFVKKLNEAPCLT